MRRANIAAGVVILGIALFFVWGGSRLPMGRTSAPGSGFVPTWEGLLLAAAAIALIASSLRQRSIDGLDWPRGNARRMILHLSVAMFGYLLLVEFLGYIASTFLFMLVAGSAWRHYSWRALGISAAAFSLVLFLVFNILLRSPLPRNPLGLP